MSHISSQRMDSVGWRSLVGILLFAAAGTLILRYSLAVTAATSLETEAGTISGNANWLNDGSASNGKVVAFGRASSGSTDITPPTVTITSPKAGITFGGSYHFLATASDDVGVAKVVFTVDGTVTATVTSLSPSVPGSYKAPDWNSRTVANGTHVMAAQAFDAAGNASPLSTSTVTIKN